MKTPMLIVRRALLGIALLAPVFSAASQGFGFFSFNNGHALAPIYGPEPENPFLQKWENTASAIYPGTQTYAGAPLAGANYSVEAWYSLAPVSDSFALITNASPVAGSLTRFTVPTPGFFSVAQLSIDGVWTNAPGATYGLFLQVRAWDNAGGQIESWNEAWIAALAGSGGAVGWSEVFWQELGFGTLPVYNMDNFQSFDIFIVPEPSTFALVGVGGLSLLLFRRR